MQVMVGGILTSYTQSGSGERILLMVHGWNDSSHSFESLTKELSGDYRVVSIDLPGAGASDNPGNAWQLDDFAEHLHEFVQKLGLNIYAIVGHSNGAAIAIRAVATGNLSPAKLILIASAGIRNPNSYRLKALKTLALPAKAALKMAPKSTQRRVKRKLYDAIGSDYMVAEHLQKTFSNVVSADVLDDAKKIRVPTCLVYGDKDRSTPLTYGQLFAKNIPNARLHVIENTGHFVHQEQVYQVALITKEFLK